MTISWLTPDGEEPAVITVSEGDRSWRLDEYVERGGGGECEGLGNAAWPAWSPDGETIAFWASPQVMDRSDGFSRLDAPWNLYLMDPDDLQPHKSLDGVVNAHGLAWSPDGQWVTFTGEVKGRDGTWMLAPPNGRPIRVSADRTGHPVWSQDGRSIVGLIDVPIEGSLDSDVVIYDVAALLSGE